MNPMRSLAPAVVGGQLSTYWIYLVGPMVGATIAVGFEYILKGRATAAGAKAAQGALGPEDSAALVALLVVPIRDVPQHYSPEQQYDDARRFHEPVVRPQRTTDGRRITRTPLHFQL